MKQHIGLETSAPRGLSGRGRSAATAAICGLALALGGANTAGAQTTAPQTGILAAIGPQSAATITDATADTVQNQIARAFDGRRVREPWQGGAGAGIAEATALWAQGYGQDVEFTTQSAQGAADYDGYFTGGMFGIDAVLIGGRALLGFAFHRAEAEFEYAPGGENLSHETTLEGVRPYFGFESGRGFRLWGMAGLDRGTGMLIDTSLPAPERETERRDVELESAVLGGYAPIYRYIGGGYHTRIGLVLDNARSKLKDTDDGDLAFAANRLRVGAQVLHSRPLPGDLGDFDITADVAARRDSGEGITGEGYEAGLGLGWRLPQSGVRIELDGKQLFKHVDESIEEARLIGSVSWTSAAERGGGLSSAFKPRLSAGYEAALQADGERTRQRRGYIRLSTRF